MLTPRASALGPLLGPPASGSGDHEIGDDDRKGELLTVSDWALLGLLLSMLAGLVMLGLGLAIRRRHKRFLEVAQRVPGAVSGTQTDAEGDEDAVVSFMPLVGVGAGRPMHFANGFDTPSMQIGEQVWVLYDPADPSRAVVAHGPRAHGSPTAKLLLALGGLLTVMNGVFAIVMPSTLQDHADMMQSGYDFADAVRGGDRNAMLEMAAADAEIDFDYLQRVVAPSESFDCPNSASGSDDGCASCVVRPVGGALFLSFVKRGEKWRVKMAGPRNEECALRLSD